MEESGPSLLITQSILDDACRYFASKKDKDGPSRNSDEADDAPRGQSAGDADAARLKLPAIRERPRKRRRERGRRRHGGEETETEWNVVVRMDWRENVIDKRTIYSEDNARLLSTLEDVDRVVLPPLDCSPRMSHLVPDGQDLLEKVVVLSHNLSVGAKTRYKNYEAVLPSVYADFFSSPERRKRYIDSLWRRHRSGEKKRTERHREARSFCDVMGNKYCARCREANDRQFALFYESSFLPKDRPSNAPPIGAAKLKPSAPLPDPESLPREDKSLRKNTFLMPIHYLPEERAQLQ